MLNAAPRLPGIRFEPRAAPLGDALPRMDVAVFVGFAASGPLHLPVAVEDPAQFRAVFGADLPLARDPDTGETVSALLAPTVRAFFANGGRRCWVIRVAGDHARYGHFPLPGVLAATVGDDGGAASLRPAFARARSQGSWADALRIATALRARALRPAREYHGGRSLRLAADGPPPADGDLLRITAQGGQLMVFARVRGAEAAPDAPDGRELRIGLGERLAFASASLPGSPPGPVAVRARIFGRERGVPPPGALLAAGESLDRHPFATKTPATVEALAQPEGASGGPRWSLELPVPPSRAPAPGTWVQFTWNRARWWLVVDEFGVGAGRRGSRGVRVRGRAWRSVAVPRPFPRGPQTVDLVSLDLRALEGREATWTLRDLALAGAHPRCWNALPSDEDFYGRSAQSNHPAARTEGGARFPFCGAETGNLLFLPLAVPSTFGTPAAPLSQDATPLARDGLARFDAAMFLDEDLRDVGIERLMNEADFLRYLDPHTRSLRRLRGIHGALGWNNSTITEEASLIAVPDAVHRAWHEEDPKPPPVPTASPLLPQPDWWHHLPCDPAPKIVPVEGPDRAEFLDSDIREIPPPTLLGPAAVDPSGTFTLHWSSDEPNARFTLEESALPDFSDARVIHQGPATSLTLYGRSPGHYYFRARVRSGRNLSHWSPAIALAIPGAPRAVLDPAADYDRAPLLAVQRALLRLCAGNGELFAVLSLPGHYREKEAREHADLLGSATAGAGHGVPAIGPGEARALSHGALYHPWLVVRGAAGGHLAVPPEGAAAGVLAARAIARGAWVAPANEPLREIVALAPALGPEHWLALQEARINLVRREPRGFLCLDADTLSRDPQLRPINVRRLLTLLRRLALRRGAEWVFEPLGAAFRRQVQRGLEALLLRLYQRGAFAGAYPAAAYQVVTGPEVNSPQGLDQGRIVVEIKVAPSLPLTFLSIRLVNAGERFAVLEGA
jgi:hypothetical protein